MKFVLLEKELLKKSWSPEIYVKVGMTKIKGDQETLSIVRHVGLHVDCSSMKSPLGLYVFTFVCEVNLDGLHPFDQCELLDCNSHEHAVLDVKWP